MTNRPALLNKRLDRDRLQRDGSKTMTYLNELSELVSIDRETYIKRHFRLLIGKGITQNQAAEKYGLSQTSISMWSKRGYIRRLGIPEDDPTAVLVDEADVAYASKAFQLLNVQPGQKLFKRDGNLHLPKHLLNEQLLNTA